MVVVVTIQQLGTSTNRKVNWSGEFAEPDAPRLAGTEKAEHPGGDSEEKRKGKGGEF